MGQCVHWKRAGGCGPALAALLLAVSLLLLLGGRVEPDLQPRLPPRARARQAWLQCIQDIQQQTLGLVGRHVGPQLAAHPNPLLLIGIAYQIRRRVSHATIKGVGFSKSLEK